MTKNNRKPFAMSGSKKSLFQHDGDDPVDSEINGEEGDNGQGVRSHQDSGMLDGIGNGLADLNTKPVTNDLQFCLSERPSLPDLSTDGNMNFENGDKEKGMMIQKDQLLKPEMTTLSGCGESKVASYEERNANGYQPTTNAISEVKEIGFIKQETLSDSDSDDGDIFVMSPLPKPDKGNKLGEPSKANMNEISQPTDTVSQSSHEAALQSWWENIVDADGWVINATGSPQQNETTSTTRTTPETAHSNNSNPGMPKDPLASDDDITNALELWLKANDECSPKTENKGQGQNQIGKGILSPPTENPLYKSMPILVPLSDPVAEGSKPIVVIPSKKPKVAQKLQNKRINLKAMFRQKIMLHKSRPCQPQEEIKTQIQASATQAMSPVKKASPVRQIPAINPDIGKRSSPQAKLSPAKASSSSNSNRPTTVPNARQNQSQTQPILIPGLIEKSPKSILVSKDKMVSNISTCANQPKFTRPLDYKSAMLKPSQRSPNQRGNRIAKELTREPKYFL